VLEEDPGTIPGTIRIMKKLIDTSPHISDTVVDPVFCHGDQLTIERMVEARKIRSGAEYQVDRLPLEPMPQEFHKRGITLQVSCPR